MKPSSVYCSCNHLRRYPSFLDHTRDSASAAPCCSDHVACVSIVRLGFGFETVNEIAGGLAPRGSASRPAHLSFSTLAIMPVKVATRKETDLLGIRRASSAS